MFNNNSMEPINTLRPFAPVELLNSILSNCIKGSHYGNKNLRNQYFTISDFCHSQLCLNKVHRKYDKIIIIMKIVQRRRYLLKKMEN